MEKPVQYCPPITEIRREDCENLIRLALNEDAPDGDHTSTALFKENDQGWAGVVSREDGIFCGRSLLNHLFAIDAEINGGEVRIIKCLDDGEHFKSGDRVLELEGNLRNLLRLERTAMNFIQYLSAISSNVGRAIQASDGDMVILDTRKTLPGYRRLSKYAVHVGGGVNHRINLSAMSMIKDNHIAAAGGIVEAIKRIRDKHPGLVIELEVEDLKQIPDAVTGKPDIIMLDNMDRDEMEKGMQMINELTQSDKPFIEASGGWTPEKLSRLHGLGRIGVSMGCLTHTTRFVNLSMEVQKR